MFEQAFKAIDNALRQEAGCATELDYTEQTSWLLFLKYLDGLEEDANGAAQNHSRNLAAIDLKSSLLHHAFTDRLAVAGRHVVEIIA